MTVQKNAEITIGKSVRTDILNGVLGSREKECMRGPVCVSVCTRMYLVLNYAICRRLQENLIAASRKW